MKRNFGIHFKGNPDEVKAIKKHYVAWQVPAIVLQILNANRQAKALQMAILDTYTCKNCGFAFDMDLQSGRVPMGYRWCPIQWHKNMGPFRHMSTLDGIHGWVRTNSLACPFFCFEPDGRIGR